MEFLISKALFIVTCTAFGILLRYTIHGRKVNSEKHVVDEVLSYAELKCQVENSWKTITMRRKMYVGALVIGYMIQKYGEITQHQILGNAIVISVTYFSLFIYALVQLINDRKLDMNIINHSLKGLKLETVRKSCNTNFFHEFINENFTGSRLAFFFFFRVIILSCVCLFAIYHGISAQFNDQWALYNTSLMLSLSFIAIAWQLWLVGCRHLYTAHKEIQDQKNRTVIN